MFIEWLNQTIAWLVSIVEHLGVAGIFIMTFLESTFLPIPSEITMLPAGYLIHQGKLPLVATWVASVAGTTGGAYCNYLIARSFGRNLFFRFGKYFFMTPEKLIKLESFFAKHGAISTFTGRLIPGLRHYISFPAGLARMGVKKFLIYTSAGGALWMSILLILGYHIGENKELMLTYMPLIKGAVFLLLTILILVYMCRHKARTKKSNLSNPH